MIALIADDLTGAVELAGIGLRYALRVEILTLVPPSTDADLLVIATDTRSMTEQEAVSTMADLTVQLITLKPDFLYKKVDSVLRGHVLAELHVHLNETGLSRALLVPANPALNRQIIDGRYFVDGQPIHLSSFANDTDFPIKSAEIHMMLRCEESDIEVLDGTEALPEAGIIVAECSAEEDLKLWAAKTDRQTLLAGGSGFFAALLESLGHSARNDHSHFALRAPALYVSGTSFDKSRKLIGAFKAAGAQVFYLPENIIYSVNPDDELFDSLAELIVSALNLHQKAVLAIDEHAVQGVNLREKQALLVRKVCNKVKVKELLIEGGATALAIVQQLNLNHFIPVQEFSTGVVRLQSLEHAGLFLTLKPGSYAWPTDIGLR